MKGHEDMNDIAMNIHIYALRQGSWLNMLVPETPFIKTNLRTGSKLKAGVVNKKLKLYFSKYNVSPLTVLVLGISAC